MRLRRPSPAMIVALVALVIALGGTAFAASRFVITSTSQIKPSVLSELRSAAAETAVTKPPKGPKAIIDRVELPSPIATTTEEPTSVPLTNATWTQAAHQLDLLTGQLTVSAPPEGQCLFQGTSRRARIEVSLDGAIIAEALALARQPGEQETRTHQLEWLPDAEEGLEGSSTWLMDTTASVAHTITVKAVDDCPDSSHFTIDSLQVDVLGFR